MITCSKGLFLPGEYFINGLLYKVSSVCIRRGHFFEPVFVLVFGAPVQATTGSEDFLKRPRELKPRFDNRLLIVPYRLACSSVVGSGFGGALDLSEHLAVAFYDLSDNIFSDCHRTSPPT